MSRKKSVLEATRLHGAPGKKILVLTTDDEDDNDWEDDADSEKSEPVEGISRTTRSPVDSDEEEEWSSDSDDENGSSSSPQPAKSWHSRTQASQVNRTCEDIPQRPKSIDVSQAALKAPIQPDMFAKKPKRAWSGVSQTGSGLLSQLMNPDPELFPVNHPYRSLSSGEISPTSGRRGFGGGIAPLIPIEHKSQQAQQEERSKAATNSVRGGKFHLGTSPPPPTHASRPGKASAVLPVADTITATSVGYRPRGRPADADFESDDETESEESKPPISSVAEQKLALLAGRRDAAAATKRRATAPHGTARPALTPRSATDSPTPPRPSIPILRTQSQPAKIQYPYNLPPPIPPSSPRTTVQLMLRSEMSESVRYNLLWSRKLGQQEMMGPRRRSSGASSDAFETTTTTLPTMVHLSTKKKPGPGVFLDESARRPANSRRSSDNAVPSARNDTERDIDGIHVGGGPNVITRTTSWTNLSRTAGLGMTKIS